MWWRNTAHRSPPAFTPALTSRMALPLLAVSALVFTVVSRAAVKIGDPFPPLAAAGVVNLAGGELPATAGQVVLVDFWASWCAPCKASFPAMAKLHADYSARGLVIAAISVDEKPAAATAFWKRMAPPFPTLHDREHHLVSQVVVPAMPTSYVVGRDGRVRLIQQGFHGSGSEKELRRAIEAALAGK
jgi:thiol-disulfide isomerase/thioredoxin